MNTLALFASGSGSNVENIYNYFKGSDNIKVGLVLTDNKNAYVLERAKKLNIPHIYFNYKKTSSDNILKVLFSHNITYIVLGGYLRLIPKKIIKSFNNKILKSLFFLWLKPSKCNKPWIQSLLNSKLKMTP